MVDTAYWTKNVSLFVLHIGLWTLWTLMIRFSQENGTYNYDTTSVILVTEIVKLILSIVFHFSSVDNYSKEVQTIYAQKEIGVYFAVPAFIYALYNTLFFLNLTLFDPIAYRVLINIRVLWSGLLFQFFFAKRLGLMKWIALATLMLACGINQMTPDMKLETDPLYLLAIGFQAFCSSFAGVYSELLLKKNFDVSLNVKNMYLYIFSIIFNLVFILVFKPNLLFNGEFFDGYQGSTVIIIGIGALCGFSTSLFLKYLNILLKEYAHSGEMFATAACFWIFFDAAIEFKVVISIILVSVSVILYNKEADKPEPRPEQGKDKGNEEDVEEPNIVGKT